MPSRVYCPFCLPQPTAVAAGVWEEHLSEHVAEMAATPGPSCERCTEAGVSAHRPCYGVGCFCLCSPWVSVPKVGGKFLGSEGLDGR